MDNNEQTIKDIQNIQDIERKLYDDLEKSAAANTLTPDEREKILTKIAGLSQMRKNIYESLKDMHKFYIETNAISQNTLAEQKAAIAIVNRELDEAKRKHESIVDGAASKMRMVEINTYYGKQYAAFAELAKIAIVCAIIILVLTSIHSNGWMPQLLYGTLVSGTALVGLVLMLRAFIDINARNNQNFDTYSWFGYMERPPTSSELSAPVTTATGSASLPTNAGVCIGETCCVDGLVFDTTKNVCVTNVSPTEGFVVNNILRRLEFGSTVPDVYLNRADEPNAIGRGSGDGGGGRGR